MLEFARPRYDRSASAMGFRAHQGLIANAAADPSAIAT
jgi:hypothetical protein